jgi:hypothetical protein
MCGFPSVSLSWGKPHYCPSILPHIRSFFRPSNLPQISEHLDGVSVHPFYPTWGCLSFCKFYPTWGFLSVCRFHPTWDFLSIRQSTLPHMGFSIHLSILPHMGFSVCLPILLHMGFGWLFVRPSIFTPQGVFHLSVHFNSFVLLLFADEILKNFIAKSAVNLHQIKGLTL